MASAIPAEIIGAVVDTCPHEKVEVDSTSSTERLACSMFTTKQLGGVGRVRSAMMVDILGSAHIWSVIH
jgi:hypothetical protein